MIKQKTLLSSSLTSHQNLKQMSGEHGIYMPMCRVLSSMTRVNLNLGRTMMSRKRREEMVGR
jgi:hypothetical protein